MDIHEIMQLSPEEKQEILKTCPPPDRYILMSSSNEKTAKELEELYSETKARADAAQEIREFGDIDLNSPEFQAFAQSYTATLIDEIMDNNAIAKDGEMVFVLGSPGAGKSSAIKTEKEKRGAHHADADKIKEAINEQLGIDINHPQIHKASGYVMKNFVIPALLANKINFIQEKIGDEIGKMVGYTEDYIKNGFQVSLTLVHCDYNVCRQRNCGRCQKSIDEGKAPRLVEDAAIVEYANSPMETYLYLMNNVGYLFASGMAYCSDGPDSHTPPQVLESLTYEKGERVITPEVEKYVEQGKSLKKDAIILVSKNIAEELNQKGMTDLAAELIGTVKDYLEGTVSEHVSPEIATLLNTINNEANNILVYVLNPSRNVRGVGEEFNIDKLRKAMLEESSKLADKQLVSPEIISVVDTPV